MKKTYSMHEKISYGNENIVISVQIKDVEPGDVAHVTRLLEQGFSEIMEKLVGKS